MSSIFSRPLSESEKIKQRSKLVRIISDIAQGYKLDELDALIVDTAKNTKLFKTVEEHNTLFIRGCALILPWNQNIEQVINMIDRILCHPLMTHIDENELDNQIIRAIAHGNTRLIKYFFHIKIVQISKIKKDNRSIAIPDFTRLLSGFVPTYEKSDDSTKNMDKSTQYMYGNSQNQERRINRVNSALCSMMQVLDMFGELNPSKFCINYEELIKNLNELDITDHVDNKDALVIVLDIIDTLKA